MARRSRRQPAPATTAARPAAPGPSLGLKLKMTRAIYNKGTIGGIDVDVAIKGRMLELNDIKVSNLVGARLAVRGNVSDYNSAACRRPTSPSTSRRPT